MTSSAASGNPDGSSHLVTRDFDLLYVVPPQIAPDFVRVSPLADAAGWIDVDPATLRHKTWVNIQALGDATNFPRLPPIQKLFEWAGA